VYKNFENRDKLSFDAIKEKIENADFKILPNCKAIDACILPNDRILVTTNYSIQIFDENFQPIKQREVNYLNAFGCALDSRNNIYISDQINNCIDVYNLSLQKIKTFGLDINSNFNGIRKMTWNDSNLFVCDLGNKRIQIFDDNLKFIDSMKLDYCPYSIQVSNKTIGVSSEFRGLYFYDLETKRLLNEYKDLTGTLNLIDSKFFVILFDPEPKKVFCYNEHGFLIQEIKISDNIKSYIASPWYCRIINFKREIVLYSYHSKI
jgi:hypothetical protein